MNIKPLFLKHGIGKQKILHDRNRYLIFLKKKKNNDHSLTIIFKMVLSLAKIFLLH